MKFESLMTPPALAVLLASAQSSVAQWTTQQITLNPGWNAIHVEVQPESPELDSVFAGIPIESVWEWKRIQSPAQFVQEATALLPKSPEWGTYFPPAHPKRFLTDLFQIKGGKPLLIKLNGSGSVTLSLTGKPVPPQSDWLPASYSLVGLPVSAVGAPSFQSYFAGSVAHVGSPASAVRPLVYTLNSGGTWTTLANSSVPQRGKAYWIQTLGPSAFSGPLQVETESSTGIHFGAFREQAEIAFTNPGAAARAITVQLRNSDQRPATALESPSVAGPVLIAYRDLGNISDSAPVVPWTPFSAPLQLTLAAGERKVLQLTVRRNDFSAPAPGSGPVYTYQSLIDVTAGGLAQTIGVTAEKDFATGAAARSPRSGTSGNLNLNRCGLWLGTVTVSKVSWAGEVSPIIRQADPAYTGPDRTVPVPTADEFQFKVLFHVNAAGQIKMLQRVIQVFENGTYASDPLNPGTLKPATPGKYRFFTSETAANQAGFTGTALRDGKFIARRWSTAAFAIRQPVTCSTPAAFGNGTVSVSVFTDYNDPLNPYRHRFHPQHDNLDALYQGPIPAGIESFDIRRDLEFVFGATHPEGLDDPAYGYSVMGGTYKERIKGGHFAPPTPRPEGKPAVGPHSRDIFVEGKFLISRISDVELLD